MATDTHHLICGTGNRYNSPTVELCRSCHNDIHNNNTANRLSKMLGQALFEKDYTRAEFMETFTQNFLPERE